MRKVAGPLALAVAAIVLVSTTGPTLSTTMQIALTMATLGISFQLVFGLLGELSLGQPALFGTGCYTFAVLSTNGTGMTLSFVAAAVLAAAVGAGAAAVTSRLGGAYFAVATLSLSGLGAVIVTGSDRLGADVGVIGIESLPNIVADRSQSQLIYAFILFAVAAAVFVAVRASRIGRSLEAVRTSPDLARSLGISVPIMRVVITALSGLLAGLAGAVFAQNIRFVGPDVFGLYYIITPLAIVALGGARALWGTIPGAVLVVILPRYLDFDPVVNQIFGAVVLLVVFVLFPGGLFPKIRSVVARRRSRRSEVDTVRDGDDRETVDAIDRTVSVPSAPAEPGDVVLDARGVTVRFGAFTACDDMAIELRQGEVVGLIGANGAGKSTFVNAITGHVRAEVATLSLGGRDIRRLTATRRARSGLARTFQQPVLMDELSVRDSLKVSLANGKVLGWFGPADREEVDRILKLVGLTPLADQEVAGLTFLDRRLLGIALALAASPRVLILDEATAGLTNAERHAIGRVVVSIARSEDGPGVIVIEHDVPFVADTCDRIIVMHEGAMIKEGLADEVLVDAAVVASYLGSA